MHTHRRSLFVQLPVDTLVDDLVLLLVNSAQDAIVYDADSVAMSACKIRSESRRAPRGAGAFGSIRVLWPLLNPLSGWTPFVFAHWLLRVVSPFSAHQDVRASLFLARHSVPRIMAEVRFCPAAVVSVLIEPSRQRPLRLWRCSRA